MEFFCLLVVGIWYLFLLVVFRKFVVLGVFGLDVVVRICFIV